ncbi:MAG: enoyl-CoA hydratase/isomerase family protein [Rhodocyclaceae bacterium]|nr:enoyl-CoA hydratase/isomerase family protein [Rhodocyclaceae bacterium]
MAQTVLLDVEAGVATLTLNRPEVLNALSVEMMDDLARCLKQLRGRGDFSVLVIEGAGEHFMAGGDIREFAAHLKVSPESRLVAFRAMIEQYINPAIVILQEMHQPVIAKVRGACAGFGLSLMLGCDLAICAEDAKFTSAYTAIALSADGGMSYFLPRLVGTRKAMEMLLLADRIGAHEAQRLGLVNRVVADAELDAETAALARRLAGGPRQAYGEIKRLLLGAHDKHLAAQLESEAEAFARCSATGDFAEGITAFLDKRKPGFEGR